MRRPARLQHRKGQRTSGHQKGFGFYSKDGTSLESFAQRRDGIPCEARPAHHAAVGLWEVGMEGAGRPVRKLVPCLGGAQVPAVEVMTPGHRV